MKNELIEEAQAMFQNFAEWGLIKNGSFLTSRVLSCNHKNDLRISITQKSHVQFVSMLFNTFDGKEHVPDPKITFFVDFRKLTIVPHSVTFGLLKHKDTVMGPKGIDHKVFSSTLVFLHDWIKQLMRDGYFSDENLARTA